MTTALVKASQAILCGECGAKLTCDFCDERDLLAAAKATVRAVMKSGGRNATAQLAAASMVLDKHYLTHLSDEDLLAEVRRRRQAREADNG